MILHIKWETISHTSVLTAVRYQHPQQWQDDKASMLLMDRADMVVVLKGLDFSCPPTVRCHIERLTSQMKCPREDPSALQETSQKSPQYVVTRPIRQAAGSVGGRGTVGCLKIWWINAHHIEVVVACTAWTNVRICQCTVHCAVKMTFPVSEWTSRFSDFTSLCRKHCNCTLF